MPDTPPIKLFAAVKAFIVRDGKVLVIRESSAYRDGTQAGKYDVVGGRIEPGQAFDESLYREVKEETGLEIVIGRPFFVNESRPVVRGEPWHVIRIFFRCDAKDGDVVLGGDHDDFLWIDPSEYKNHPIIENLHPAFEILKAENSKFQITNSK